MHMHAPISINNVTIFNRYIYEKIHKINNGINKLSEPLYGNCMKFSDASFSFRWLKNVCVLYLIGTSEDVEELSMFPGLIVREVSDKTYHFIHTNVVSGYNISGILHTEDQIIRYKLETYYNLQVPDCMSILSSMPQKQSTDLYDCPYFECSDFMNPKHMTTIEPTYTQHLNPDERVYKICIQMSDDLAVNAYKKSNFFISIRNHKEKMSIKNFIEYLS